MLNLPTKLIFPSPLASAEVCFVLLSRLSVSISFAFILFNFCLVVERLETIDEVNYCCVLSLIVSFLFPIVV